MAKDWEKVLAPIQSLYVDERKPLQEVQELMMERHGFHASIRSYRSKIEEWGFKKQENHSSIRTPHKRRKTLLSRDVSEAIETSDGRAMARDTEEPQLAQLPTPPPLSNPYVSGAASRQANKIIEVVQQRENDTTNLGSQQPSLEAPSPDLPYTASLAHLSNSSGFPPFHWLTLDLPAADVDRTTLLHRMVIIGSETEVRSLLQAGAKLDNLDADSNHPLHCATIGGNPAIMRLLIDSGAQVDAIGQLGKTPLHLATRKSLTSMLIQAGASVSIQDFNGDTPLHVALNLLEPTKSEPYNTEDYETIELLLEASADINQPNHAGLTPFHVMLRQPPRDSCTQIPRKVIHHVKLLLNFLERGGDIITPTVRGDLPFLVLLENSDYFWGYSSSAPWPSVREGFYKIFKSFLDGGANPHTLIHGQALLHWLILKSTSKPYFYDVKPIVLLCSMIDVSKVGSDGEYPLHFVIRNAKAFHGVVIANLANLLLSYGASPFKCNHEGFSPLAMLFKERPYEYQIFSITQTLLTAGSHPFLSTPSSDLPIYLLARNYEGSPQQELATMLFNAYLKNGWWLRDEESRIVWHEVPTLHWLEKWRFACKAVCESSDWPTARSHLKELAILLPSDVRDFISKTAMEVLANFCILQASATFEFKAKVADLPRGTRDGKDRQNLEKVCSQIVEMVNDFRKLELKAAEGRYEILFKIYDVRKKMGMLKCGVRGSVHIFL